MDKGFAGGADDSTSSASYSNSGSSSSSNRDVYLKHVSRNSHKISKPIRKPLPLPPTAAAPSAVPPPSFSSSAAGIPILDPNSNQAQPQSQQPPVYNINKNDFRDVVQKLTGSPAHERFSAPAPPAAQTRPPSSRLQRIRPPPLSQLVNRPTQIGPQNSGLQQPFTPLPPLPSVHPAAESPISAYMRFFQTSGSAASASPLWSVAPRPDALIPQSDAAQRAVAPPQSSQVPPAESPVSAYMRFLQSSYSSSTAPPQWNATAPPQQSTPPPPQQPPFPTSFASLAPFPALPLSPLPFGCIPSPKSPYGSLFSPTGQLGLPQLPLSPTLPVPSPRWKGM